MHDMVSKPSAFHSLILSLLDKILEKNCYCHQQANNHREKGAAVPTKDSTAALRHLFFRC